MYNKFEDPNMLGDWISQGQEKPETFTLELTPEELDFLYERCSRKAQRLEEAGLKDIPCYRLSWQVMSKISKVRSEGDKK